MVVRVVVLVFVAESAAAAETASIKFFSATPSLRQARHALELQHQAQRYHQISLMHEPAGGECLPLKSRGKSLTLDLLTVC
jgi:hypothetical protein